MLKAAYYFMQRMLVILTFVINVLVIQNLSIGRATGIAFAVAVFVVGQWLVSAGLMYRVTLAMFQHEVDENHNEYLEALLRNFKYIYIVVGPIGVFLADWIIPLVFLFR